LGVVEPIDAQSEALGAHTKLGEQAPSFGRTLLFHIGIVCSCADQRHTFKGHADWIWPHATVMTVPSHRHVLAIGACFQHTVHRGQKVMAMHGNMKAEQIRAEQAVEQFILPWADAEGLRIGPWDVPEEGYA